MTKLSELPKAKISSRGDLITIIQGGAVRNISKENLLGYLEGAIKRSEKEIDVLQAKVSKDVVLKDDPTFKNAVTGGKPTAHSHLTTKKYVDDSLHNVVRNDGSVKLYKTLSLNKHPEEFAPSNLVSKLHVDELLKGFLKTVVEYSSNTFPEATPGDCFIMTKEFAVFATDGPELQMGDILICLKLSAGGTYSEANTQFAILNTNVVSSTEINKGIIKVASAEEMINLSSNDTAITPKKFKVAAEGSSVFNRTTLSIDGYRLLETDKGIIAVDSRKESINIELPSVTVLNYPKLVKYVIKDEFGQSDLHNITVVGVGSTIDGKNTLVINKKYQAVTIYNDGKNYYIENNTHSEQNKDDVLAISGNKNPVTAAIDDIVYSFDIDLTQFDVNEGMEIEASGKFGATTNDKTAKILFNGVNILQNDIAAPNAKLFTMKATVLKSSTGSSRFYGTMNIDASAVSVNASAIPLQWTDTVSVAVIANCATAVTDISISTFTIKFLK